MATEPDRTVQPPISGFSHLEIPNPTLTILPNGIEVYAIDAGDQPINRITLSYGSGLMEAANPDALKIATQLLREGTASYSGNDISQTLDYHGAWLKSDALTHNTTVSLWSLNKSTTLLLPLLREILQQPTFPEKEFATLRDKHKARYMLSLKNVTYVASQIDKELTFGAGHPMCRVLNEHEIDAITTHDVRQAYDVAFRNPPKLFVAGEIGGLLPEIEQFFSGLKFSSATTPAMKIMPMEPSPAGTVTTADVDTEHQAAIVMSLPTIDRSHPDYIALRLAVMALGGYFGSRLMSNIREDKGYTYGIEANLYGYREGGLISIATNAAPQYVEAVIAEVKHEMLRLCDEPMPADELAVVKNNAMTSLAATLDTPFSIMDHHISHFHTGTPANYFDQQVKAINSLTVKEIQRLARQYFRCDEILTSIARPAAQSTD